MRFYAVKKPTEGDIKTVTKFLWLPITLGNETRWLERATMQMQYTGFNSYVPDSKIVCRGYWWRPERFID